MSENNKTLLEVAVFVIAVAIIIMCIVKALQYSDEYSDEENRKFRQKQIQQIDECIEKTNDFDWCMDKFYK